MGWNLFIYSKEWILYVYHLYRDVNCCTVHIYRSTKYDWQTCAQISHLFVVTLFFTIVVNKKNWIHLELLAAVGFLKLTQPLPSSEKESFSTNRLIIIRSSIKVYHLHNVINTFLIVLFLDIVDFFIVIL